jgi:hypothetical protein
MAKTRDCFNDFRILLLRLAFALLAFSASPVVAQDCPTILGSNAPLNDKARAISANLAPDVKAALQPLFASLDNAERDYATLPLNLPVADRLMALGRLDQAGRRTLGGIDFAAFPGRGETVDQAIAACLEPVDDFTLREVMKLIPPEGWFRISKFGKDAALAAFHIVNHGGLADKKRIQPVIEAFARQGEAEPDAAATLYDKIAISEGRPQRYGTQFECKAGRYVQTIEDPDNVEVRRKAIGMSVSHAEYLARLASVIQNPPCPK